MTVMIPILLVVLFVWRQPTVRLLTNLRSKTTLMEFPILINVRYRWDGSMVLFILTAMERTTNMRLQRWNWTIQVVYSFSLLHHEIGYQDLCMHESLCSAWSYSECLSPLLEYYQLQRCLQLQRSVCEPTLSGLWKVYCEEALCKLWKTRDWVHSRSGWHHFGT